MSIEQINPIFNDESDLYNDYKAIYNEVFDTTPSSINPLLGIYSNTTLKEINSVFGQSSSSSSQKKTPNATKPHNNVSVSVNPPQSEIEYISEYLSSKGALPSTPLRIILNGLYENDNCFVALVDTFLNTIYENKDNQYFEGAQYKNDNCNPTFIELLKHLQMHSKTSSPTFVLNRKLKGNSANAFFTTGTIVTIEAQDPTKAIGGKNELVKKTKDYFFKVQMFADRDNLTVDNIIGYILTYCILPKYSVYFSEYIDCFISQINDVSKNPNPTNQPLNGPYTIDPHHGLTKQNALYRKVNVQSNLTGYISMSDFFKKLRFNPEFRETTEGLKTKETLINNFLKDFHAFCHTTLEMSNVNGFVHNDAHMGNIFYNSSIDKNSPKSPIVMIDFGRVRFHQGFWNALNMKGYTKHLEEICKKSCESVTFLQSIANQFGFVEASKYSFFFDIATMTMNILKSSREIREKLTTVLKNVINEYNNKPQQTPDFVIDFSEMHKIKLPHYSVLQNLLQSEADISESPSLLLKELESNNLTFIFIGLLWFVFTASDFSIILRNQQKIIFYTEDNNTTQTFHMDLLHKCNFIASVAYQYLDIRISHNKQLIDDLVNIIEYFLPEKLDGGGKTKKQKGGAAGLPSTIYPRPVSGRPGSARPVSGRPGSARPVPGLPVVPPVALPTPDTIALNGDERRSALSKPPRLEPVSGTYSIPKSIAITKEINRVAKGDMVQHYNAVNKYIEMNPEGLFDTPPYPPPGYSDYIRNILPLDHERSIIPKIEYKYKAKPKSWNLLLDLNEIDFETILKLIPPPQPVP